MIGNGRRLSERISGGNLKGVFGSAFVGSFVLLLAAGMLLESGFRPYSQKLLTQVPASPILTASTKSLSKEKPDADAILNHLPLIFEPNQGQAEPSVKFLARGAGYGLYLDPTGAVLALQTASPSSVGHRAPGRKLESVRMTLVGANPAAPVAGRDRLPGKSNYFLGNDPEKWHTGIPQFAGVHYQGVYPGIDLVFYGNQGHLEYDFQVAPGADPSQAELQFDGAAKLELSNGDLILKGFDGGVRFQAPHLYQSAGDRREPVEGRFVLRASNRVGFEIGAYDRGRELVIDPILSYSTYFGGSGSESFPSIAVNGNQNIYLAGATTSAGLPTTAGAFQSALGAPGAQNIFVLELNPSNGAAGVIALTYLGGSGMDSLAGLGVDNGGNAFLAGTTSSPDFPTTSVGYQTVPLAGSTGASHVFVSALNSTFSTLSYSTYLSGNGTDIASGMAIDNNGNVFVTGTTTSTNSSPSPSFVFPASFLPKPFQQQPSPGSTLQFFVTQVNTRNISVASVPYSTYFGGATPSPAVATGGGIAVDTAGNVYFSGTTNFYNSGESQGGGSLLATDFPILNAYQPCLDTPPPTVITFPVACSAPATTPYPTDAFVAKLNPANAQTGAAQLIFSTYMGGTGADSSTGIAIDTGAAAIYITGSTNSSGFVIPTGTAAFQECLNTPVNPTPPATCPTGTTATDAYVAKFTNPTEAAGSQTNVALSYFSYLGGTGDDSGLAIAVDTASGALVTGATSSGTIGVLNPAVDFPVTTGAIQTVLNGPRNAFFAHIDTVTVVGQNVVGSYATYFGGNGTDRGTSIVLDSNLNSYFAGDTNSTNFQTQGALQSSLSGPSDAFAVKLETATSLCITCPGPVLSPVGGIVGAGNPITITFTVTNQGPDLATNITVNGQLTANATFSTATAQSGTCSAPTGGTAVCTIPTLQSGSTSQVVFTATPTKAGNYSATATVFNSNDTNTSNSATAPFTATDFKVSVLPFSQTVAAGGTAVYSVKVTPDLTFGNNVSLTCGSLPTGAGCGFTQSTLTFNGPSPQSTTLNLTTTVRPVTTITSRKWRGPVYALWLIAPGLALLGLGGGKRGRNRLLGLLALSVLFWSVLLQPACSSAKQQPTVSGTPAGSYPLTITATSGSFTQSVPFSLTVQ